MSRWLDRVDEKDSIQGGFESGLSRSGGAGQAKRPMPIAKSGQNEGFAENHRERFVLRERKYVIRKSGSEALFETGRFRHIDAKDLVKGVYGGDEKLALSDLRSLKDQKLITGLSIRASDRSVREVLSLTEAGANLVRRTDPRVERDEQVVYAGHVKIAELEHDSLLYRAYLSERGRLNAEGATVQKIVLDYELKKDLFSREQKRGVAKPTKETKEQSAAELALPVVEGRVLLPDFRIEYEDEEGERSRVDVEVATSNYRPGQISAKLQAGFRVYGAGFSAVSGGALKGNISKSRSISVFPL